MKKSSGYCITVASIAISRVPFQFICRRKSRLINAFHSKKFINITTFSTSCNSANNFDYLRIEHIVIRNSENIKIFSCIFLLFCSPGKVLQRRSTPHDIPQSDLLTHPGISVYHYIHLPQESISMP